VDSGQLTTIGSLLTNETFTISVAAFTDIGEGTLKMRDMKLRDMKMRHQNARVENARHENERNAKVWNTACCICLSIAEQECMSRQERAPDFAANCVLVDD